MKATSYILLFLLFFTSCTKEEFKNVRPDEKLNKLRNDYTQQLTGAKNGWIGYLFPEGGRGYTFKFYFDEKNRVKTYATIDQKKANESLESSYRIAADQVMSLYFDTYSYIHQLSDPDETKSGGSRGGGLVSDFEFSILSVSQDTIKLKGNHNQSDLLLIRAQENEGEDFIKKAFALNQKIDELNQFEYYYNTLTVNQKETGLIINSESNTIAFYYDENGIYKTHFTEYAMSANGIVLRNPLSVQGTSIYRLDDFKINRTTSSATVRINNKEEVSIKNTSKPLVVDKESARKMYLTTKNYFSSTGFTIAGKKDGLNVKSFPGYSGIYYIPRRYIDPFDALYIIFNNGAANVGPIFNSKYNAEGVMTFKVFRALTGTPPPFQFFPIIVSQNSLLFDDKGYYVFQTGTNFYDLVSVKDSKNWIRFN